MLRNQISKVKYLSKDFRFICFGILFSNLIWLLLPTTNWFSFAFYLSLVFILIGILFSQFRLFFLILLATIFFYQAPWIFFKQPKNNSFQQCGQQPQIIQAKLNQRKTDELLLSNLTIWCGKNYYLLPSAVLKLSFKKYLQAYPSDTIEIRQAQALYHNNSWQFKQTEKTNFFSPKQRKLRESRNFFWRELKLKSAYYLDNNSRQFYQGIALADRSNLSRKIRKEITSLGIFHLFAISGLHIGMIFFWINFILSKIISLFMLFFRRLNNTFLITDLLSIFLVWFYLDFIASPITATRAVIMLSIFIFIKHFSCWIPLIYLLLITSLVLIIINSTIIFSLGFQLSFLAVLAISTLLTTNFFNNFANNKKDSILKKLFNNFIKAAIISFWISIFLFPLTAIYFKQINLASFLINPPHIFFVGLIYLPIILIGFVVIPLGLEQIYFYLVQKLGDIWYWFIYKNIQWSNFAILRWDNNLINSYLWLIYALTLTIFTIYYFKTYNKKISIHNT